MKKILLTVALIAAAAFSANSQIRVEAVGNLATVTFSAGSVKQDAKAEFGFGARAFYAYHLQGDSGFDFGLSFMSTKSTNEATKGTLCLNNLQLPIHAFYDLNLGGVKITPYLGLYAGYALSGKSVFDVSVAKVDADPFAGEGGMKRFDFGSDDEILVTFGGHFNVGVGVQISCLNLCKDKDVDIQYNNLFFSLGYAF